MDDIVKAIRKEAKHKGHLGSQEECPYCMVDLTEGPEEEPQATDPVKERISRILGDE
jgi:hypothetical protein